MGGGEQRAGGKGAERVGADEGEKVGACDALHDYIEGIRLRRGRGRGCKGGGHGLLEQRAGAGLGESTGRVGAHKGKQVGA